MKSEKIGWISALLASACCAIPLLAVAVGLGSVGLGSLFGNLEPYLDFAGLLLLGVAWAYFVRERRRACAMNSAIRSERRTIAALSLASLVVLFFAASGLLPKVWPSSAGGGAVIAQGLHDRSASDSAPEAAGYLRKVLKVDGMSCASCIPPIQGSLAKVPGVRSSEADLQSKTVTIVYDPGKASAQALVDAVRTAGFKATAAD